MNEFHSENIAQDIVPSESRYAQNSWTIFYADKLCEDIDETTVRLFASRGAIKNGQSNWVANVVCALFTYAFLDHLRASLIFFRISSASSRDRTSCLVSNTSYHGATELGVPAVERISITQAIEKIVYFLKDLGPLIPAANLLFYFLTEHLKKLCVPTNE